MPISRIVRALAVTALLMLGGCVGDEYNYDWETPVFAASSNETVVVVVQDQRPYVLVGDKRPSFVGLQRIAFGIPYNVSTASGRPLADDMADTIVRGLAVNDVAVKAVYVPASADASIATQMAIAADTQKGLILLLREWKTDTMVDVAIRYDVIAHVIDSDGNTLATSTLVSGPNADAGGDFWDPIGYATDHVPETAVLLLETLINQPNIVAALE